MDSLSREYCAFTVTIVIVVHPLLSFELGVQLSATTLSAEMNSTYGRSVIQNFIYSEIQVSQIQIKINQYRLVSPKKPKKIPIDFPNYSLNRMASVIARQNRVYQPSRVPAALFFVLRFLRSYCRRQNPEIPFSKKISVKMKNEKITLSWLDRARKGGSDALSHSEQRFENNWGKRGEFLGLFLHTDSGSSS